MKSNVSFHLNPNDQPVIQGSFVESILLPVVGGLVPWECEPRHSEQLRPCALSAELIWPTFRAQYASAGDQFTEETTAQLSGSNRY